MLLATRCPFCETVFRLQPAHLAARRGLVRCGHCQEVFDASSGLYELPDSGDFRAATPVSPETVAALTAGSELAPHESPLAAPAAAFETSAEHDAREARVEREEAAEPFVSPAVSPVVSPFASAEADVHFRAEEYSQPVAPHETHETAPPASDPHAATEPIEPFDPQFGIESTTPSMAPPPSTAHTPHFEPTAAAGAPNAAGQAPDFGSASWDPWAAPPDVQFDERLRYSKVDLPYTTFAPAVAPMRRPKQEMQKSAFEPAPPSPPAPAPAPPPPTLQEPVFEPTPERDLPPPHQWKPVERDLPPRMRAVEPDTEPTFRQAAASPAELHDSEPHFGPAPAAEPFAEPFAESFAEPFAAPLPQDDGEHFAVVREPRAKPPRPVGLTILGTLIALALLVLLIGQLAWWQRETVMVYWPASQPLYAQACAQLGCTVGPPRDIEGLVVEPSDLRQIDNNPHRLELKMPIRNRFSVALAYPAVELTLLDDHNNIVVRRVLFPQDYVPPGTPISAGLPAHASQTMVVRLDVGNAVASNFLAQIFYP